MSSNSKSLPAEPEQPPLPPPKDPPQVPPKDDTNRLVRNKYAIRLGTEGGRTEAAAAEEAESDFSDSDEGHGLLHGKEKRRTSWKWLRRSRSWILAIIVSFLLACLTIKLFRHRSNRGENGGPKSGSPFRIATPATPAPQTAQDYALNFPEQYPPLTADASEECRAAWKKLKDVPCHSQIWARNWDAGKMRPLGPDLSRYLPLICRADCTTELQRAADEVGQLCRSAGWDVAGYKGRFNTTSLEESPAEVLRVLRHRQTHDCQKSPRGDAELGYCMTDLEQRWWIWDGIHANHMANLNSFLRFTNEKKTEPRRKMSGVKGGKDWSQRYDYWREERQFGPGKGDTTCSWCTAKWFIRMLEAWDENTADENGDLIDLPYYLARIYQAGRRCSFSAITFQRMFDMQIKNYKIAGRLDDDWEESAGSGERLPPGKSPTLLDHPLPAVRASIKKIRGMTDGVTERHKTYLKLLEDFHEEAQSLTCNSLITFEDLQAYFDDGIDISPLCDQSCQHSRQGINNLFSQARRAGQPVNVYIWLAQKYKLYSLQPLTASEDLINAACRTEKSLNQNNVEPCSVVFHRVGRLDWIRRQYHDPKDLALTVREAVNILPNAPANLTDLIATPESELSYEARANVSEWTRPLRNGACSLCFWRRFVEGSSWAGAEIRTHIPGVDDTVKVSDETLLLWFGAVKAMYERCGEVGVRFEESEYNAVMGKIPERISERLGEGTEVPEVSEDNGISGGEGTKNGQEGDREESEQDKGVSDGEQDQNEAKTDLRNVERQI